MTGEGSCTPTQTWPHPQPFELIQDVCGTPMQGGGGCGSRVCAPNPTADYPAPICIRKIGFDSCPPGWGSPIVAYQAYNDLRQCTDCSCTTQAGSVTCTGTTYTAYDDDACGGGSKAVSTTSCQNLSALADYFTWSLKLTSLPTPSGGVCQASGGTGSGAVETLDPVVFCCK